MVDRSGIPSKNVGSMYDKLSKVSPKAVFDKWNECFPVSPLVSIGSV